MLEPDFSGCSFGSSLTYPCPFVTWSGSQSTFKSKRSQNWYTTNHSIHQFGPIKCEVVRNKRGHCFNVDRRGTSSSDPSEDLWIPHEQKLCMAMLALVEMRSLPWFCRAEKTKFAVWCLRKVGNYNYSFSSSFCKESQVTNEKSC